MFRIVETLKELEGATLTELADEMEMAPSTTHRYLTTLEECAYVKRENGEYYIGLRFLDLGGHALNRNDEYRFIETKVEELAEQTEERAQFLVEDYGEVVYTHRAIGKNGVNTDSRLGLRLPINATAAGKAILSQFPDPRIDKILKDHDFPQCTEYTITEETEYRAVLEQVSERGYSFNDQEYIEGIRSVGVPINHPEGRVLGTLAIAGPTHRFHDEFFRDDLPRVLMGVANEIELELAY